MRQRQYRRACERNAEQKTIVAVSDSVLNRATPQPALAHEDTKPVESSPYNKLCDVSLDSTENKKYENAQTQAIKTESRMKTWFMVSNQNFDDMT